ncbi:hypothetical protein MLD38_023585 [Melastoma candidum]|uniref:Uncharacterized protein n=1 Tax=Melastoma candidum TaxID=119954 RepID=A0ACB9NR05_9MYRT|nr:hypothetical protein MLD38_023585 [Melastoma candidum]
MAGVCSNVLSFFLLCCRSKLGWNQHNSVVAALIPVIYLVTIKQPYPQPRCNGNVNIFHFQDNPSAWTGAVILQERNEGVPRSDDAGPGGANRCRWCRRTTETICNVTVAGLEQRLPSVRAQPPTGACCWALKPANFPCFCQYMNSPVAETMGIGIDIAMKLPEVCNITGAPTHC